MYIKSEAVQLLWWLYRLYVTLWIIRFNIQQYRHCTSNEILRHVRVTIVAMEK